MTVEGEAPAQGASLAVSPRTRAIRSYREIGQLIALTDLLSLLTAMLAAHVVRFGMNPILLDFSLVMGLAPLLMLAVFSGFSLYGIQRMAPAEEFRRAIAAISVTIAGVAVAGFWSKESFSRLWLGIAWVLGTILILASRQSWHRFVRQLLQEERLVYRTLIIGTNNEARRLEEALASSPLGFRPIGFVPITEGDGSPGPVPNIGTLERVGEGIRETKSDCLFVASSAVTPEQMGLLWKTARQEGVEVRISANLPEVLSSRFTVHPVGDAMAVALKPVRLRGRHALLKRGFDSVMSTFGLVVTAPVLVAIAIAIKLTSKGPVLFQQVRVGKQGRPFTLLKFRTMINGADAMVSDLSDRNEADGPLFKIRDDPRITRIGRWLRKWSLDELPQLVNVLKGEMSLVGPRPPLPREVDEYEEWHHGRMEVAPGITGVWQVNGRSDLSFDEYVRRDLFYIENWSLSYDVFILLKTIPVVLGQKGSY